MKSSGIQINRFENDLGKFIGIYGEFVRSPATRIVFGDDVPVAYSDRGNPGSPASFDIPFRIPNVDAFIGGYAYNHRCSIDRQR